MISIFLFILIFFFLLTILYDFNSNLNLSKKVVFAIILQSIVISISLGYYFWSFLSKFPQKFLYPISGNVSFEFENKDSDILAIYFCILVFLISFILIKNLYKNFEIGIDYAYISLIPFAILLGQWIKVENTKNLLFISLIFVLIDILIKTILKILIKNNKIKLEDFNFFYKNIIHISFFFLFSSFGIFLFTNRIGLFVSLKNVILFILFLILTLILLKKKLDFFLILSQVGLPFLLSVFLAPVIIAPHGEKSYFPYKNLNYYILFILFVIFIYNILKKFFIKENKNISKLIAPTSIALILILLMTGPYNWPYINKDDFHLGHYFLPWYLLKEFGQFPFLECQPAYGLLNYLPGFLSYIFYDGTYSGISMVGNHYIGIFLLILFFTLKKEIGIYIPIILIILGRGSFASLYTIYFFSIAIFLFLLNSKIKKHFLFFLWIFSSAFLFLWSIPDGVPLVLGTIPFGIFLFIESIKNKRKVFIKLLIIFFLILFSLSFFTDFEKIFLNGIKYLIENANVNTIAQGIKWDLPPGKKRITLGPLWQFLRVFWIFIPVFLLFLIIFKRKEIISNKKIFFLLIFLLISIIFLIPRAFGRIDKGEFSRPYAPNFLLFFVFPILIFPFINKEYKIYFILIFSILLGAIGYPNTSIEHSLGTLNNLKIYKAENTISGEREGLSGIGKQVIMDLKQLERQKNLRKTLKNLLKKGETFYNTTNHNADYIFQGLPIPTRYYTIYDISSKYFQMEVIKELKEKEVPLVLISSENYIFDGGTLPFRAPEVYFYLLENYTPFEGDSGYIWMIKKNETKRLEGKYEIKDLKGQIELLNKAFFMKNLKYLPASWGASIVSISKKLEKEVGIKDINLVDIKGIEKKGKFLITCADDQYLVFEVPPNIRADYFYIYLKGLKNEKDKMQIFWANDLYPSFDEKNSQIFNFSKFGKYLIPISYSPSFKVQSKRRFIRLDFQEEIGNIIKIKDLAFYNPT